MAKASKTTEQKVTKKALFELPALLLRKLKYIALIDETSQVNIVETSLTEFVERWEKKNGSISLE